MFHTFFSENRAVYEIWGKHYTAVQAIDENMAHVQCMLDKSAETHSEYATLTVFPRQQWLQKHASMLSYTYSTLSVLLDRILMTKCNGQKILLYIFCHVFYVKHCNFKM